MVASASHDRLAFAEHLSCEYMQEAPDHIKALSECTLEAARKLTSPTGISRN